jgi:hypothetical protein
MTIAGMTIKSVDDNKKDVGIGFQRKSEITNH